MTDTTDIKALIDRLRSLAKTATPGKWWIDSHGEALVAFTDAGMKTVLKPEHLRDNAHRDENTGGLSYWPNDSDASWIAAAQPQNIIALLDQLEAERQRADKSDAMLSECLESLKAAEKELGIRSHQLVKADASVADLEKRLRYTEEALIAVNDLLTAAEARVKELKGDQVPVAFTGSGSLAAIKGGHEGHIWGTPAEAHPVPLFTAPQKPVVLPQRYSLDGWPCVNDSREWMDVDEVIAAIEAAGGIVKDGE